MASVVISLRLSQMRLQNILTLLFASFSNFHVSFANSNVAGNGSTEGVCALYPKSQYDVLIYGCTPAGIVASVQVRRMKKSVALVCPENHLGGMLTSGLGWTDSTHGSAIGGIAREFFGKVYEYYKPASVWNRETRDQYLQKHILAQPGPAIDERNSVQWTFEPHAAESILEDWMKAGKIEIHRREAIDRLNLAQSYEGDLMASAGIPYSIGSEARNAFGESLAGIQIANKSSYRGMDPFVKKGESTSGLLPGIERVIPLDDNHNGSSDVGRLQPFNYRLSLTEDKSNQVPFFKPREYDAKMFELLLRYIETGYTGMLFTHELMPNKKSDTNSFGPVSTDMMGGNYNHGKNTTYLDVSDEERAAMVAKHKLYTQGFFWTLVSHPRVPKHVRHAVNRFGYAKDEWTSNGHWPYEVYLREGRRMKASYTMTQHDIQSPKKLNDAVVGLGSYTMDVHEIERLVINGKLYNEGHVHTLAPKPFPIWYNSLTPERGGVSNFLNPITMGSTHIAFASLRMEPTYTILGQSAATAAVQALEQCVAVQDIDRKRLSDRLSADKQKLTW